MIVVVAVYSIMVTTVVMIMSVIMIMTMMMIGGVVPNTFPTVLQL